MMIELALAFAAGVVTVAAPCILPMLPILLGASIGQRSRARPLFIVAGFILAFSVFALLFGTFPTVLGLSHQTVRTISIILLGSFGLLMLWPRPYEWLVARLTGLLDIADGIGRRAGSGNPGGFVLGLALGIVWTPCAGPVLGSILALIAASQNLTRSGVLLACYATGAGIPMLLIACGGQYVTTRVHGLARYATALQRTFGAAVLLVAIAFYTQYDTVVTVWLSDFYPNLQTGL
jgi:cytochrome c-type biogenesis protein